MPRAPSRTALSRAPSAWQATAGPHLHRRPSNNSRSGSVPLWGHCYFPLDLGAHKILFVPLQEWSLWLPQSCGNPVIKSCSPSKAGSLEVPSPFARYPGWEAWCEAQNLHNSGRTSLVVLFSSSWVTYLVGVGLDFILLVPPPISLQLLLCLWTRGIFFGWVPASSCRCLFNS